MNIAICDDNIYLSTHLESLVDAAFLGDSYAYECEIFPSGDSLLEYLNKNPLAFQIYLLDIEMEGTDGLEAAKEIREKDENAVIIFVTSHGELMPEAFKVLAFQYIVKPFEDDEATRIILSAIELLQRRTSLFQFVDHKKTYTLYLSQIEYMESVGRKMRVHTVTGEELLYYGTLKDAVKKTDSLSFARPHNSYIVNLERLQTIESGEIVLRSGERIPISGKFHDSFHSAWRNFILLRTK